MAQSQPRPSGPPSIPCWDRPLPPGWGGRGMWKRRATDPSVGGHAARSRRDLLLPAVHAVQSRFGWVTPGALDYICRRLTIPPAEAHGVVTFYHLFSLSPRPMAVAHVCDDIACRIKGAERICVELTRSLGPESDGRWKRSPCLGLCERAPAALVVNAGESPTAVEVAPAVVAEIVRTREPADPRRVGETHRREAPIGGFHPPDRAAVRQPVAPPAPEDRPRRPGEPRSLPRHGGLCGARRERSRSAPPG